jgi:peptidoglycan hydrolase-like protein with peptidoglycan-binding domain
MPSLPAEPNMSEADRRQIQEALHRRNYYTGPVDGIFGPLTRTGIRRFQRDIGVDTTGSLTAEQANRLVSSQ